MSTVSDDLVVDIPRSRIAVASMVGTTVEFYDFYVYATAAVSVFPQLFFPRSSPTTALLASLATFGLAFVARPVGSMLFGHFGDRVGRKATLVASLLVMGIATFAIGLLPTYPQVGLLAPALLAAMRFAQGLALGGEWKWGGPAGHRNRPTHPPRVDGDVAATRSATGLLAGQRGVPDLNQLARTGQHTTRSERRVLHVGLADPVSTERVQ